MNTTVFNSLLLHWEHQGTSADLLPRQPAWAHIAPKAHSSHPRLLLSTREEGSGDVDAGRRGERWDTELQMLQSTILMFFIVKTGT